MISAKEARYFLEQASMKKYIFPISSDITFRRKEKLESALSRIEKRIVYLSQNGYTYLFIHLKGNIYANPLYKPIKELLERLDFDVHTGPSFGYNEILLWIRW